MTGPGPAASPHAASHDDPSPAIHIDTLRVRRGSTTALHGVSLTVPRSQLVGLIGPSGCGKTTLMRAIIGVQVVQSGTVTVLGRPAGSSDLRRRVGYVTQEASVYDDLTVRQNLRYFASVLGAPRSDIDRVLAQTDLAGQAGAMVAALSGGQRNRVSLATALLGSPDLLVLDEPTVGLDPVLRVELWNLFHRLATAGTSLLVSSHVMDEAARCDRLVLMRDGAILADDTPRGLLTATVTDDLEAAFLALIPRETGAPDRPGAPGSPGSRHRPGASAPPPPFTSEHPGRHS